MSSESGITKKLITGGCICGKAKFTFLASPKQEGTTTAYHATRCNCTFCTKTSSTNYICKAADFTLLSPSQAGGGKDGLSYYSSKKALKRYFCPTCGVHCWLEGSDEYGGKMVEVFAVNLAAVDQPQDGFDLSEVKLGYYDMLSDNFGSGLKDTPWKGGLL